MKELEEKILRDGTILPGDILKVGNFLNHQVDINLLFNMAKEVKKYFKDGEITKILTIEASGIAFATAVAREYNVPLVFGKKSTSSNVSGEQLTAEVKSYTHQKVYNVSVPKDFINENDNILIVDDFLATGEALRGLINIVKAGKANVIGCVVQVEKVYQNGGNELRSEGYKIISLAGITYMSDCEIRFN